MTPDEITMLVGGLLAGILLGLGISGIQRLRRHRAQIRDYPLGYDPNNRMNRRG